MVFYHCPSTLHGVVLQQRTLPLTHTHTNIVELLDTGTAGSCNRQDKRPKSDYRLEARAVV